MSSFRKLNPEHLKLLEAVAAKTRPGQPVDRKALIAAMKDALGDVLDDTTMKALEVRRVVGMHCDHSGGDERLGRLKLGSSL